VFTGVNSSSISRCYSGNVRAAARLLCFESHARLCRAAWQGGHFVPRCIPRSRGFSQPLHPRAEALPLRLHQAVPPGPDQGLSRPLDPRPGVSLLDLDQHLLDRSGARAAPEPGRTLCSWTWTSRCAGPARGSPSDPLRTTTRTKGALHVQANRPLPDRRAPRCFP
jgi:hypothetical protein